MSQSTNKAFAKFDLQDQETESRLIESLTLALIEYAKFTHPTPVQLRQRAKTTVNMLVSMFPQYFDKE